MRSLFSHKIHWIVSLIQIEKQGQVLNDNLISMSLNGKRENNEMPKEVSFINAIVIYYL